MIAAERRQKVLDYVKENGSAKVSELSHIFHVSEMTIHRDLSFLEEHGHVEKKYGGVISSLSKVETAFHIRKMENWNAKQKIGQAAAALVKDGDTILLDASTTCLAMVPALEAHRNLIIFTTGIATASALLELDQSNQVFASGGEVSRLTMSITGPVATDFLRKIHVDKCFLGGAGVHPVHGVTDPGLEEVEVKKVASSRAKELILLADRTKFGRLNRFSDFPLSEIDLIITDGDRRDPVVAEVAETGVNILYVNP